ncbi:DNA polymerase I [Entomobacter blattae]|uniref:DNA polymerase I n=1 Tax=Entomobacter blattae TaxID=2762277 RepID=A0A7H1NNU5_9PROT|nr:DNA polymerase I [Entomobacter blattae]QNT77455.1 DNA polymerase I [Entomobacter blattae]
MSESQEKASQQDPSVSPFKLVVIDGSGFIFRAYHALPFMSGPEGVPVNAVYGFTNMLARFLKERIGTHLAVIFDAGRQTFRNKIYPQYKAHRPDVPEDLIPQFALIREATAAFGIPAIEKEGWEADDLIAAYAKKAVAAGGRCIIVSSDKDLMQLVNASVSMFDPIKSRTIGIEEVKERFGVEPGKVIEVQALMGDSVDNVPGVPGIGPKTATQLIQEYGSLEEVLAAIPQMKPSKRRENLENNREAARISLQLVKLDDEAPCPLPLKSLSFQDPNPQQLEEWLQKMQFRSILQRLNLSENSVKNKEAGEDINSSQGGGGASSSSQFGRQQDAQEQEEAEPFWKTSPYYSDYEGVTTEKQLDQWVNLITQQGYFALDTETTGLNPLEDTLVGISLAVTPGQACYIPLQHKAAATVSVDLLGHSQASSPENDLSISRHDEKIFPQLPLAVVIEKLSPLLAAPAILKIFQNAKFDMEVLHNAGFPVITPIEDTMLISYVLSAGKHGNGMDELSLLYLGHAPIPYDEVTGTGRKRISFAEVPIEKATRYAAEDADVTLRLWLALKPRLLKEKLLGVYEGYERPLIAILAAMEEAGIKIDAMELKAVSKDFAQRMAVMEEGIHHLAGRSFNLASPKQLGEILYDEMGIPGGKKTKSGTWSTDASTLQTLAEQGYDLPVRIVEWRQLAKLKSTYADALIEQVNAKTGRVHTSFQMTVTSTGRLSSNDPNLQNIPIRNEEGIKIRKAFIANPGYRLLSADYSQIELRLLAHVANIPALKEAFVLGQDIHARTASEVFGVPVEGIDPLIRRKAKAINFGIIYGISAFGLSRQLGISPKEAKEYIEIYFARYPEIYNYMETTKAYAKKHGYVQTPFGRRLWINGIGEKNSARRGYAERQAINAPLQGGAADIIKRAMVLLDHEMNAWKAHAKLLLQVHDELVFEVEEKEVEAFSQWVKTVMEQAAQISVPLVVDTGYACNWADAH